MILTAFFPGIETANISPDNTQREQEQTHNFPAELQASLAQYNQTSQLETAVTQDGVETPTGIMPESLDIPAEIAQSTRPQSRAAAAAR